MKKSIVAVIFCTFAVMPVNATEMKVNVRAEVKSMDKIYPWITFMSQGPIDWGIDSNQQSYGVAFRVIITTSEIYNEIIIEKISMGEEGCCKEVAYTLELDTYDIQKKFKISGEFANVIFKEWTAYNRFMFSAEDRLFSVEIGDDKSIKINEKKSS